MGGPLRKVTTGEQLRIPAAAYNAFIDAAIDTQQRRSSSKKQPRDAGSDRTIILVRNESEDDVPRFGVLGIDSPISDPEENAAEFAARVSIRGEEPAGSHFRRFVIPIESIASGSVGRAMIAGVGLARVMVPSGASQPDAVDVTPGDVDHLSIAPGGAARVLWIEPGDDGVKLAIVALGLSPTATFPVLLAEAGGSGGDAETGPTWVYDVVDPASGITIDDAVDPTAAPHHWKRPTVGAMTAATFGYAHRGTDGVLVLGWINETFVQQVACEGELEDVEDEGGE